MSREWNFGVDDLVDVVIISLYVCVTLKFSLPLTLVGERGVNCVRLEVHQFSYNYKLLNLILNQHKLIKRVRVMKPPTFIFFNQFQIITENFDCVFSTSNLFLHAKHIKRRYGSIIY